MNLCRACLSSDKELFPSDDNFTCNYNLLTNINVKYSDAKPQCFCQNCIEAVNCFMEFRNKCISAENALLGILEQAVKTETNNVKLEIKCEFEDSTEAYFEKELHDSTDNAGCEIKKEECNDDIKEKRPSRLCKKKKTKIAKKDGFGTRTAHAQLTSNNPTCGLCGKEFEDAATLSKHVEDHEIDHGCQLCSAKFQNRAELYSHRMLHTVHSQGCHLCNIKFKSHTSLEFHYRKIHYGEKNITMNCSFCPKKFSNPRKLSKHIWNMHGTKNQEYTCDICFKKFDSRARMRFHLLSHTDAKPHVCDLCGYSSKYSSGLSAHTIRRHAPAKCICKFCGSAYADAEKLAKHSCSDTSQICPVCGKNVRRGLHRHMRSHTSERHYKCERCPATYKSRAALNVHRDKHDNNPRHECEYCHVRFYNASVLVKHRRVHTGEKPYACTKCDMRFTGGHNLKVHMKVHGEHLVNKRNKELEDE